MSRIGNKSIALPDKVKVNVGNDGAVAVEGPKGKLNWKLPRDISAKVENNHISLARAAETRSVKALHGLSRALLNNMVQGVSEGFRKDLEIEGVGFAGVKGFLGGFGRGELAPFGEPITKAFVDEALNEARKLENQLRTLRTERSVAVLHYSPIVETIAGEPEAIYQYLGSQRLCDPIDRFDHVKAVVHGHAHHGTYEGRTPLGKPVYNVAQFVLKPLFGKPYVVIEV